MTGADLRIRIRIGPEIQIRIPDHFWMSLSKNYFKNTFQSQNTKQNLASAVGKKGNVANHAFSGDA